VKEKRAEEEALDQIAEEEEDNQRINKLQGEARKRGQPIERRRRKRAQPIERRRRRTFVSTTLNTCQ
jgi:hypothetical protein